jgi:hypothetical protein
MYASKFRISPITDSFVPSISDGESPEHALVSPIYQRKIFFSRNPAPFAALIHSATKHLASL